MRVEPASGHVWRMRRRPDSSIAARLRFMRRTGGDRDMHDAGVPLHAFPFVLHRKPAGHRTGDQCCEGSNTHDCGRFAITPHEVPFVGRQRSHVALPREGIQNVDTVTGNGFQIRGIWSPRAVLVVELRILGYAAERSKRRLVQSETLTFLFESFRKDGQLATI